MKIIKEGKDKYALVRVTPKYNAIVRILKRYEKDKQAVDDMTKLLVGEITESDLIGSSFEQDTEAGKLGCRINILETALDSIRNSLVQAIGDSDKLEKVAREAVKRINELLDEGQKEAVTDVETPQNH